MRLKDGFVLRDVAGQTVVIATGEASEHFHGMVKLNETGKLIWQALADGKGRDEIVSELTRQFEVTAERAGADVDTFINQMSANGFLA
ncbi:PqqD family protein [Bifidobacterium leontopitheci]|uniref:Coenzyme PQQ synthesis protein n=1 Tax=Bifidobacterium leontopitheci TaxID=2650774 RepID=A0A6I1GSZ5_9BIFI|nr:PqqD family protein [Bifidobacterium leontopitheci]KAB7789591.1 coenzyme PQQ synthesis protein [Bifidobacterium leontopitheci]